MTFEDKTWEDGEGNPNARLDAEAMNDLESRVKAGVEARPAIGAEELTGNLTIGPEHVGKTLYRTDAGGSITVTAPSSSTDVLPNGACVTIVREEGAGEVLIAADETNPPAFVRGPAGTEEPWAVAEGGAVRITKLRESSGQAVFSLEGDLVVSPRLPDPSDATEGHVLTADGEGGAKWAAGGAGGSPGVVTVDEDYQLQASDAGKRIEVDTSAEPLTVTIPATTTEAIPVGAEIEIVQAGLYGVTMAVEAGVTLNGTDSETRLCKLSSRDSSLNIRHATENDWTHPQWQYDSGWVDLVLEAGWSAVGASPTLLVDETPGVRVRGDRVWLRGTVSGPIGTFWGVTTWDEGATLPGETLPGFWFPRGLGVDKNIALGVTGWAADNDPTPKPLTLFCEHSDHWGSPLLGLTISDGSGNPGNTAAFSLSGLSYALIPGVDPFA